MRAGPVTSVVQGANGSYTVVRPAVSQRLLGSVLLGALAAIAFLPDNTGDRVPFPIALSWCVFVVAVGWAASRMRVELGPTVRITNFFRTLVLQWDDIAEFQYVDDSGARVVLVDGRRLHISAFAAGFRSVGYVRRQSRDAVRQMENRRKSRLDNRRGRPARRPAY